MKNDNYDRLWLRLGDNASYEHFGCDISALAGMMAEFRIAHVERCGRYGVSAPGFENCNYISLYWGDKDAEAVRDLTDNELAKLNKELEALA